MGSMTGKNSMLTSHNTSQFLQEKSMSWKMKKKDEYMTVEGHIHVKNKIQDQGREEQEISIPQRLVEGLEQNFGKHFALLLL